MTLNWRAGPQGPVKDQSSTGRKSLEQKPNINVMYTALFTVILKLWSLAELNTTLGSESFNSGIRIPPDLAALT